MGCHPQTAPFGVAQGRFEAATHCVGMTLLRPKGYAGQATPQ